MTRWHVVFTGRVQHVGFRYTAYYFSRDLYLTGWVDNKSDGSVEMEVQGGPLQLQELLSRLKGRFDIDRVEVTKKGPDSPRTGVSGQGVLMITPQTPRRSGSAASGGSRHSCSRRNAHAWHRKRRCG